MSLELEKRLEFLEEQIEVVRMENRVLTAAIKGIVRGFPQDLAVDVIESIQFTFDKTSGELNYHNHPQADVFHDVTYDFFHEKE